MTLPYSVRRATRCWRATAALFTRGGPSRRVLVAPATTALILGSLTGVAPWRPATAQSPAQPAAQTGGAAALSTQIITGKILGANRTVVVGAQVTITPVGVRGGAPTGVGRATITDDDGQFRVPGVPTGLVTVAVRRIGYQAVTLDTVSAPMLAINVTLVPVVQKLAAVVVHERRRTRYTGPLADFNRRRDMGFGHFITAADIDNQHPTRTTDLLRMIPGVMVYGNGPTNALRFRNARCDPLVWMDGMPLLSGYLDVDAFDPLSFGGIEIYTGVSTVPVELRGTRGEESCGVIALWSRLPELRPKRPGRTYTAADLERLVDAATVYTADQVDRPAHLDSSKTLAVTYPDSLRNTHTPGEAMVEFVVDTTGAVEIGTVGVVAASHPGFADAARLAATDARFIPAERAGHPVRQLVQLPLRWETGR